ncbi:MAG: hypothetical protein WD448_05900 [Woeseia sp.]
MGWNQKYWDILEQLYWVPGYLGLGSIPQKTWVERDGLVCVPSELVNRTGPLYRRVLSSDQIVDHLLRQEEILNHVFDLTFGIVGDRITERLLLRQLGFSDEGPIESIGREVHVRYGPEAAGVTQQDGLYVSGKSVVGVELKLGARLSPEQIVKYVALLSWEEQWFGDREQLGLLFIVPEAAIARHWEKCGLEGGHINAGFLDRLDPQKLSAKLATYIDMERDRMAAVLERMEIGVISWSALHTEVLAIAGQLARDQVGDQTLLRLLEGFTDQLERHHGTGVSVGAR